jgi:L-galactose dehydrogenase/L-glyceraldehyde 3-phosphate reductase
MVPRHATAHEEAIMEMRNFGRTGLKVSLLGFGCGAVGGLMVRGTSSDQERVIARALEAGVNYFDTAPSYGKGESEKNLGRVLNALRPANAIVGTKLRPAPEAGPIGEAMVQSLEESLKRLAREQVDIVHLHNNIKSQPGDGKLTPRQVLEEVVPAFQRLRAQGKVRFLGITANGDTDALHEVLASGMLHSAQVAYNLLNPSAAAPLPASYPAQDYQQLLDRAGAAGTGVIGIRVLAGGALSGTAERHPIASAPPTPFGSAREYHADLQRAQRFAPLVEEGYAGTLAEAATRYAMMPAAVGTILVGVATPQQFEDALSAVLKGPLPQAALDRIAELQRTFAGEAR